MMRSQNRYLSFCGDKSWVAVLILLVAFWSGCDLPWEPGPMPTELIETEFEKGLNVFGLLRDDGISGSSFIRVERAIKVDEFNDTMSVDIRNADVTIMHNASSATYSFQFEEDTARGNLFFNPYFTPAEGETYTLTVKAESFPTIFASATIPQRPGIENSSFSEKSYNFDLVMTEDTGMYEVYLFLKGGSAVYEKVINDGQQKKKLSLKIPDGYGSPYLLNIYGYDPQLTEYTNAAVTLRWNTYQETVTTVEGGYGAFGAVTVFSSWLNP